MTRFTFSRVPGYDVYTGDKRIRCDVRRREFVCFVIDLDGMRGAGFRAGTLAECKKAADHFEAKFCFPDGTAPL